MRICDLDKITFKGAVRFGKAEKFYIYCDNETIDSKSIFIRSLNNENL